MAVNAVSGIVVLCFVLFQCYYRLCCIRWWWLEGSSRY